MCETPFKIWINNSKDVLQIPHLSKSNSLLGNISPNMQKVLVLLFWLDLFLVKTYLSIYPWQYMLGFGWPITKTI